MRVAKCWQMRKRNLTRAPKRVTGLPSRAATRECESGDVASTWTAGMAVRGHEVRNQPAGSPDPLTRRTFVQPGCHRNAEQSTTVRACDPAHSRSLAHPTVRQASRLGGQCVGGAPSTLPIESRRPILARLPADIASAQPSSVAPVALKSSPAGVAVVTCLVSCPAPPCAGPISIHPVPKPGAGHDPVSWPLLACADHDLCVVTRPALTSPA